MRLKHNRKLQNRHSEFEIIRNRKEIWTSIFRSKMRVWQLPLFKFLRPKGSRDGVFGLTWRRYLNIDINTDFGRKNTFVNVVHAMQHLDYECKTDWELNLTKYVVSIAGLVDINRIANNRVCRIHCGTGWHCNTPFPIWHNNMQQLSEFNKNGVLHLLFKII